MRATPRAAAPGAPIRFRRKGVGRVAAPSLLKTVVCNLSLSLEQRVDAEARSALGALLENRDATQRRSDRQGVALTLADVIWCAAGPDGKLQSRSKLIMVVARLTGLSAGTCATWRRFGRGAPAAEAPPVNKTRAGGRRGPGGGGSGRGHVLVAMARSRARGLERIRVRSGFRHGVPVERPGSPGACRGLPGGREGRGGGGGGPKPRPRRLDSWLSRAPHILRRESANVSVHVVAVLA